MKNNRVVITGIGAVTPLGLNAETTWEQAIKGVSGIGKLSRLDPEDFPVKVVGEVKDFDPTEYVERKEARKMDRFTQYAVASAMMAVKDANLEITEEIAPRDAPGSHRRFPSGTAFTGRSSYSRCPQPAIDLIYPSAARG